MSNKTKKLLLLNLPYFITGLIYSPIWEKRGELPRAQICRKAPRLSFCLGYSLFQSDAKSASDGFADWRVLRSRSAACRVPER